MAGDRIVAGVLGFILGANGLVMIFASLWWYGVVPGVTSTGPFNPHFVRDIGVIYLVCGAALGAFAWRPEPARPALVVVAAFLTLHGCVHVFDAVCGARPVQDLVRDSIDVFLPALITLVLAVRRPGPVARNVMPA
jgi:hypothetical protein